MSPAQDKRPDFRGIGEIHARTPIGAVLQIGWRKKDEQTGRWEYAGSFGGSAGKGMKRCFNIMSPVPNTIVKRGSFEAPSRLPHQNFAAFNHADPAMCNSVRAVLVNSAERLAYRKNLGAYKAPGGKPQPPAGSDWWCRGDGQDARRFTGGGKDGYEAIPCPGRMCEFQQDGSGQGGRGTHCRCNLALVAQFRWNNQSLPEVVFQWDSKGWTNAGYLDGLFQQVDEAAAVLGYKPHTLPVIGLPIVMQLSEKTKPGKSYPVVSVSADGNLFQWVQRAHELHMASGNKSLPRPAEPLLLAEAPPDGYTAEQMHEATEAVLDPAYKPANVRKPA